MNNNRAEWQREFYLTHDKYRMQRQGTDCYKVVKGLTRILQLPTIAKLTSDNESVIGDFRLNRGEYGLEPYDEYAIKVDDTYGASLYIIVHRRADTTFLCPILVGFEGENTCAMVMPTDNWRMREMAVFVELKRAEKEFGVDGLMMAVNTRNGVYGYLSVLNESGNLLERWLRTERDSLHERNTVTAPSSAALILQIWLHTICLWKRRRLSRKVEQRIVHANGEQETVKDVRECLSTTKQTVVDLKKYAKKFSKCATALAIQLVLLSNKTKGFFGPEICNVEGKDIQTARSIINSIMGERQARFYSAKLNDEVYDTQYAVSEYAVENWADDIVPPVVINSCIWAIVANTAAEMQKDNRFLRRKEICDTEFFEIATRIYNELLGFAARKYEILDIGE